MWNCDSVFTAVWTTMSLVFAVWNTMSLISTVWNNDVITMSSWSGTAVLSAIRTSAWSGVMCLVRCPMLRPLWNRLPDTLHITKGIVFCWNQFHCQLTLSHSSPTPAHSPSPHPFSHSPLLSLSPPPHPLHLCQAQGTCGYLHGVRVDCTIQMNIDNDSVQQSSGAVWKSRRTSGLPVPNSPYGLCGRKAAFVKTEQ